MRVFVDAIVTLPLSVLVPVLVAKVPVEPLASKLPLPWVKPVIPLSAPALIIRPLIVLPDVAPEIAPLKLMVVIPLKAPSVLTSKALEFKLNVPVPFPTLTLPVLVPVLISVFAVPVVLMVVTPVILVLPVTVKPPLRVVSPVTPSVPPRCSAATNAQGIGACSTHCTVQ